MSRRRCDGKAFYTRGPAAEKLLSPKLLRVRGTTHILSNADRSWRRPVSAVSRMSEATYDGVCPANGWWTRHASLNSTLQRIGSQYNFCRTGVMRSHRRVPVIRRAAAFCMDWTFCSRQLDTLYPTILFHQEMHTNSLWLYWDWGRHMTITPHTPTHWNY